MISIIISIISAVIAVISFLFSFIKFRRDLKNQTLTSNEQLIMSIENRIAEHPDFLKFHGFSNPQATLEDIGLTSEELAYLINSFTACALYYNTATTQDKKHILRQGSYRWKMCKTPEVKKAWPVLKQFIAAGEFRDKIEKIILY